MEKTIDHLNREVVKLEEELADLEAKAKAAAEAAQTPSNLRVLLIKDCSFRFENLYLQVTLLNLLL